MPRLLLVLAIVAVWEVPLRGVARAKAAAPAADGASGPGFRLSSALKPGHAATVSASLELGGELLARDKEGQESRLPLSVAAKLNYEEQLVAWWADAGMSSRSIRRYRHAAATIKTPEKSDALELSPESRLIVARTTADSATLNGLNGPLTRREYDLLDVVGSSLVIDRLLPDKELKEGEGWEHDAATMGALLDMDHVAICEVRSIVTGQSNRQVQIRMAGAVHGTVEGSASEMDLRGAYLYHLDEGRITKFNLAIQEVRKPGEVTPGLDVVAKLSLVVAPARKALFDDSLLEHARELANDQLEELYAESPERGYRFRHSAAWYVTAEHRELTSLRLLAGGDMISHCNITTLPARPADRPMTLQQFESDIVKSLGERLEKVEAATQWVNEAGHQCLGVIAVGEVEGTPVQWRHYFVSGDGLRPVSVAVTLERQAVERFADADKLIIESMTLLPPPATATKLEPVKK
ncbi:MAG: hypothetical protein DCC67_18000 [Planctomycetota bacterium]|nr:MAG: hypothetical protein DCC67_18000 [Planctomycetota bacterium]